MRAAVAGAWAAAWLTYGVNLASFPAPPLQAFAILVAACAISLLAVPPPGGQGPHENLDGIDSGPGRWAFTALVGLAAAVVAIDIWHNLPRVVRSGLVDALVQHRNDRANQTGAYGIPGAETAHALAAATGAVGYALWVGRRDRLGAAAAVLGFAAMLASTGRWDVIGYALWCFVVQTVVDRRGAARCRMAGAARLVVLLGIFFVVHGQLMRKAEQLDRLAQMSSEQRLATVNVPVNLGRTEEPSPPDRRAPAPPRGPVAKGSRLSPIADDPAPQAPLGPARPAPEAPAATAGPGGEARAEDANAPQDTCARWVDGAQRANLRLRELSSVVRVGVVYFGGPFAAFDRVLCEGRPGERAVILYWPLKVGRLLGMVAPSATTAVDPFVDVGVPFNNFTVMYSFWSELGLLPGLLAWLATALLVRTFSRLAVSRGRTIPLVVAGVAPVAIAVRTPWTNSFFDGTLAVWIGTGLALAAVSRGAAPANRR
jgi:hypothetical protein